MQDVHEMWVEASDEQYRRALNRYWFRLCGGWGCIVLGAWVALIWLMTMQTGSGNHWVAFLAGALTVLTCSWIFWFVQYRRQSERFRASLLNRSTFYRFSAEGVEVRGELGAHSLRWPLFEGAFKYDDMWLLRLKGRSFLLLPTALLNDTCRAIISNGLRVARQPAFRCRTCGYLLRDRRASRCPECGAPF